MVIHYMCMGVCGGGGGARGGGGGEVVGWGSGVWRWGGGGVGDVCVWEGGG